MNGATSDELLEKWNHTIDFEERTQLLESLREKGLFPSLWKAMDSWEREGGLYPSVEDPGFTQKLLQKEEFAETKQESVRDQQAKKINPCDPDQEFELTPVQRFIGRFLSPETPYQSALLYHGVGVGKTCAAITIAEAYLRAHPRKSVFIVAPRTIQPGFRRTIFDDEALQIPEGEEEANTAKGCTGNSYLQRTGSEFEKDKAVVQRRVTRMINSRYTILGYIQFHRMIEEVLSRIPPQHRGDIARETAAIRREFDGRLVIIDEAHNLRDSPEQSADDSVDAPGGEAEVSESDAGKRLTPSLLKVLRGAQGMKLVLMSGTPMYNSYREIIFLMNLLLTNDKRATLSERDIFTPLGQFRKGEVGEKLLGTVAAAYVSFMRGENPLSFPVRLDPGPAVPRMGPWPPRNPVAAEIWPAPEAKQKEEERLSKLPLVPVQFPGASLEAYKQISEKAVTERGIGVGSIDEMVQSGNWLFPSEETDNQVQIRDIGFDACFREVTSGGEGGVVQFQAPSPPTWLATDQIATASPKAALVLKRLQTCKGVAFVYSRFIKSGALPLALALEANGYTPWGRDKGLLANGIQDGLGRQCALCELRESVHKGSGKHGPFVPARYILITGKSTVSPNNAAAIQAARSLPNQDGGIVKVVIGSQVASEGVDFRFIREIYMFDSWFHLNKMEQVLGRGIRTCSHALLKDQGGRSRKNCTIHLLVNTFGPDEETETADMYMYRNAMNKAIQVGRVTRVLKRYALDCNLNRDAIVIYGDTGLPTQDHLDSQGQLRDAVSLNDTPFTNLCDWLDTCEYTCAIPFDSAAPTDLSTYDEYAARTYESQLKRTIRYMFETQKQPVFRIDQIKDMLNIPIDALKGLLAEVIGNKSFRIRVEGVEGYIVYRNGLYLFQPNRLVDTHIPLALRVADVPVKKEFYEFSKIHVEAAPTVDADVYWLAIQAWAKGIEEATAAIDGIPNDVTIAIQKRFSGDEQQREIERLFMIRWLYEEMKQVGDQTYLKALAKVLLEFIWDESLGPTEQQQILSLNDPIAAAIASEQLVRNGTTEAFRYVDPLTGILRYICNGTPCFASITQFFESNPADPLFKLQANTTTTGRIYGFMVPKSKEGRLIFKTSEKVGAPGKVPEKGNECAIISTISHHIVLLKQLGALLVEKGYPPFLLRDEVLDEKERLQKLKKEGQLPGGKILRDPLRSFENTIRACTLKDIILRWLDTMEGRIVDGRKKGLRYFYRPIAAAKSGHKGTIKE